MAGVNTFDVRNFIRAFSIFAPNGSKPVTEVREGDVVVLGRQACKVVELSKPFLTTTPLDFDKSTNPKKAVLIVGESVLWPKIDYESAFLHHDDNKIGTFSGEPDIHEATVIGIKGDKMKVEEEHGQTRLLDIPDNQVGRSIRLLFGMDEVVVVRVASFLGAVWASSITQHKSPRSADSGGSSDSAKAGDSGGVKHESSTKSSK